MIRDVHFAVNSKILLSAVTQFEFAVNSAVNSKFKLRYRRQQNFAVNGKMHIPALNISLTKRLSMWVAQPPTKFYEQLLFSSLRDDWILAALSPMTAVTFAPASLSSAIVNSRISNKFWARLSSTTTLFQYTSLFRSQSM